MYDRKDNILIAILIIIIMLIIAGVAAYAITHGFSLDGIDGQQPINTAGDWIIKASEFNK